jgi:DNA-binding NarL/FixJ family response regulator
MTLAMQVEALFRRTESRDVPSPSRLPSAGRASLPAPLRTVGLADSSDDLPERIAEAAAVAAPIGELGTLWEEFLDRRFTFAAQGTTRRGRYVLLRAELAPVAPRVSRIEISVLARVLRGEQQKAVAFDFDISCSTVSKWYTHGLKKLGLNAGPLPLPLIVAAQSWSSGVEGAVGARVKTIRHGGETFVLLLVPEPDLTNEPSITRAQREVAKEFIEGYSRWEIAALRKTSTPTVACQLQAIFQKMQVTGRCALIERGVRAGWFR